MGMKFRDIIVLSGLILWGSTAVAETLEPVTFEKVHLSDRFWAPWQQRQQQVTIPVLLDHTESSVENLRRTAHYLAGIPDAMPVPPPFLASDLFKSMESAAYSLRVAPDPALEARLDSLVDIIAAAQQPDGYLYECHTCKVPQVSQMGTRPYSHLGASHELYNMGHLYEAAVAYYRATGKDKLLKVAEKNAHHIQRAFFEGDPAYNDGKPINLPPGHQEIELALCQMFEVTSDSLYLQMARRFLDLRGVALAEDPDYGLIQAQQHMPLREQREPAGHAVRACYMYTGMADVDAICGTDEYGEALETIWTNMVSTRMAITGGLGAMRSFEGFGPEYVLPNKEAYNETCASVANVFFNDRMFRNRRDGRYYDVLECALFNGALAGINLAGDRFFYVNPLEVDGVAPFNHGLKGRAEWFGCACCPPNISRLIMKAAGYLYSHTDRDIYCTLYAGSTTEIPLSAGKVGVEQHSDYPFSGLSEFVLTPEKPMKFALRLRIPTWARSGEFLPGGLYTYADTGSTAGWTVKVNGKEVDVPLENGFAVIDRRWKPGDRVTLHLPMEPRYVQARPEVEADIDRWAVVRGPLVYCAEGVDNGLVQRYYLPEMASIQCETITEGPLEGIPALRTTASMLDTMARVPLRLIPYFAWDNRGETTMVIWMPRTDSLARESLPLTVKNRAWLKAVSFTCNNGEEEKLAILDGMAPARSHHMGMPYWTSRGCENESQVAEFIFTGEQSLDGFSVYWIDDARTTTAVPASWELEYLSNGQWQPFRIYMTDRYGTQVDQYNLVHAAGGALSCEGLRVKMTPQEGKSVGMAEVRFDWVQ